MQDDTAAPAAITIPDLLQGAWTSVVVLTYNADLAFLESRLLGQLAQIPLRVVLADHNRLANRFAEAADTGQRLRTANRTYLAGPIRHPRAAHAKAIFLASATEGLLVVGSGNLGQEGYASPGELWHVFAYDDHRPEHLAEFMTLRGLIDGLAERGALDPPTTEMLRLVWSRCTWLPEPNDVPATLRHNLEVSLLEQLAAEVTWEVDQMTTYAPFHDADCAALSKLIERFKPRRLRVLISRDTSVDADRLSSLLSAVPRSECVLIEIRDEPRGYVHAKWVHLMGAKREAVLTGSANLSRSALLNPAAHGNIELGVISIAARGQFDHLYAALSLTGIEDPHEIGVTFQSEPKPSEDSTLPILLWSRLDDAALTLTFDRAVDPDAPLTLVGPAGAITVVRVKSEGAVLVALLEPADAAVLTEGGHIEVTLGSGENPVGGVTWPYHLAALRARLERASNRDLLGKTGILPDGDAELFELLQELESTLIFDPVSAWRVAKHEVRQAQSDGDESSLRWEDLDWDRIRRDPRYTGYHYRGVGPTTPPTDIQVVLAAIAGRLGELGRIGDLGVTPPLDDEHDLANSADPMADAEKESDDSLDEVTRRRLPISTRTRMAFNRFVTRYAAASRDKAFTEKLGSVLAVHNAAIFNHLLVQLLSREIVDPTKAIKAQIAAWEVLWGSKGERGILGRLEDGERAPALRVLEDAQVRSTTLRALSHYVDYDLPPDLRTELRSVVTWLIGEPTFGLDAALLGAAEPDPDQASALLRNLEVLAGRLTTNEIADSVVVPLGRTFRDVEWGEGLVRRADPATGKFRDYRSESLVVRHAVDGLDHDAVRTALERFVIATHFADKPKDYWRIRFAGNGSDVGYWDAASGQGLTMVNGEDRELEQLDPQCPHWLSQLEDLEAVVRRQRLSA